MPEGEPRLRVLVGDEHGRRVSVRGLAAWLGRVAPRAARGVVSVALVSDRKVRALNRTYRHKDCATDVLSFAAERSALSPKLSPQPQVPSPPAPSWATSSSRAAWRGVRRAKRTTASRLS